jgi:cathepsin C
MLKMCVVVTALALLLLPGSLADTPANCTYEDIQGTWKFYVGNGGNDNTINCRDSFDVHAKVMVTLTYPDIAKDQAGNRGFWTMIYNQGFEVVIGERKYFAFSNYTMLNKTAAVSHCSSTFNGWSHNIDESDWACYFGWKMEARVSKITVADDDLDLDQEYVKNLDFVNTINNRTQLWEAIHYPEMEGMTLRGRLRRAGGIPKFGQFMFPDVSIASPETKQRVKSLPLTMDWREVEGKSYVTPIRNQGQCGSCYAFGSTAMLESRTMIMSKGAVKKVFSPQDVVGCSEYSQGCDGGFPYLIAGKYAEDFGVVEESCFPYLGKDSKCMEKINCTRYRATDYKYVGGYYGACSEEEMMLALQDGPVSVSFEVTPDFEHYKRGVYHATGLTDRFNPFRITNHVVLIVGYGEEGGVKYWTVKNSWGASWGEDGFFRIRRGTNELNIESMAVVSTPVTIN